MAAKKSARKSERANEKSQEQTSSVLPMDDISKREGTR
jgi:hypothetical protein